MLSCTVAPASSSPEVLDACTASCRVAPLPVAVKERTGSGMPSPGGMATKRPETFEVTSLLLLERPTGLKNRKARRPSCVVSVTSRKPISKSR